LKFDLFKPQVNGGNSKGLREMPTTRSMAKKACYDFSIGETVMYVKGSFEVGKRICSVIVHPSKPLIIIINDQKVIQIWNYVNRELLHTLGYVETFALCPDEKTIISGSKNGEVKLWDIESGECLNVFSQGIGTVQALAINHSGTFVATSNYSISDFRICIRNVISGDIIYTPSRHSGGVTVLIGHPTDDLLASGSFDSTVRIWRFSTGEHLNTLDGHRLDVNSLTASASFIVSGSFDHKVRVWSWTTGECIRVFYSASDPVWNKSNLLISDYSHKYVYDTSSDDPMKWTKKTKITADGFGSIDTIGNIIICREKNITIYESGMKRQQTRTKVIKEELIRKAWHPDRICKWIEEGYDPSDF
jgi:WD40 repeat protein